MTGSGGERESSTARSAAALQAAIDQTRARLAAIDRDTAEGVCRINDSRLAVMHLLDETRAKLSERTAAAKTALRATERRRRRAGRRARRQLRKVTSRICALQLRLLWRRSFRWVVLALITGACLWWAFRLWTAVTSTVRGLITDPPAAQSSPPHDGRAP